MSLFNLCGLVMDSEAGMSSHRLTRKITAARGKKFCYGNHFDMIVHSHVSQEAKET